jgi:hypothetical protein
MCTIIQQQWRRLAMNRYNLLRPLLILIVAFAVNNVTKIVCQAFGVSPENTDSIAIAAMVIAALFVYTRLTRNQRRK